MPIIGQGQETYLYITGLSLSCNIKLASGISLLPVNCPINWNCALSLLKNDVEIAIAVLCSHSIGAQLKIEASDSKELAIKTWNTQWDIILLSAILNSSMNWSLQSNVPIEKITSESRLNITNYNLHGIIVDPYVISAEETTWVQNNFSFAQKLLDNNDAFMTAVHAMATYTWHSMPRIQLAILWTGIEALFGVTSELSFRISLYIANFLADDVKEAKSLAYRVKKLYGIRSSAVHGNKLKDKDREMVKETAIFLQRLIRKCIANKMLPNIDELLFFDFDH